LNHSVQESPSSLLRGVEQATVIRHPTASKLVSERQTSTEIGLILFPESKFSKSENVG
jgi:hypothetical protein